MLAEFLDVTQNKESILNHTVFYQLLERLVFKHEPIDLRLNVRKWKPYNQVCFQRQLSHIKWTSEKFS